MRGARENVKKKNNNKFSEKNIKSMAVGQQLKEAKHQQHHHQTPRRRLRCRRMLSSQDEDGRSIINIHREATLLLPPLSI